MLGLDIVEGRNAVTPIGIAGKISIREPQIGLVGLLIRILQL